MLGDLGPWGGEVRQKDSGGAPASFSCLEKTKVPFPSTSWEVGPVSLLSGNQS